MLHKARNKQLKEFKKDDISQLKDLNPSWIRQDIWNGMVGKWSDRTWKKNSEKALKNKNTKKDGEIVKHTGGSISFSEYKRRLETKFQRKVNTLEVYEHVHKHREKDGTQKDFCDNKSKRVKNVYTTKVSAKYGSDVSSQTSFDSDAWIEVVGGATKGRTYGLETFVDPKSSRSSFSASSRFEEGASSQVIDDEQLKIIEERIREDVRKGFEVEMEERMKTQLEKLLAEYLDHGASSSGLRDGVVSQHGASSSGHA